MRKVVVRGQGFPPGGNGLLHDPRFDFGVSLRGFIPFGSAQCRARAPAITANRISVHSDAQTIVGYAPTLLEFRKPVCSLNKGKEYEHKAAAKTVAVFNSNEDVIEMLRQALEGAGFNTVAAHVPDIKRGEEDFVAFLKEHDPDIIVDDIAPPYLENWNFLKLILDTETAKRRKFVLTTANEKLLKEVVGDSVNFFELSEKPANLEAVLSAVKRSIESNG